jgi:hypothetical protein
MCQTFDVMGNLKNFWKLNVALVNPNNIDYELLKSMHAGRN